MQIIIRENYCIERENWVLKESKERLEFIIDYISAYEQKIRLANKNNLFDEAQLFELFAQQICKLWFGQDFINLNMIKKNYPFVDLRSADGAIFVQVSTQATIFDKIKTTLRELEKTDIQELANITTPVFFVLSNESELKVKDLIDEKQIGKYPFTVEKNIISTAQIVQRAKNDINFQIALYKLLKEDVEGVESLAEKILFIFDNSRTVGLFNIDTTINGEYEIDRSSLTNQIRNDNNQFILITGEAGSGKSSICKKILINENVFFVRADKLANCHSIDNIWDISITKAFRFLQGKRVIIYIDALEYIASANESVKMLVQSLLNEINRYPNLSFIASCRTCDKNAFIKLIGLFNIKEYTVEPISNNELREICRQYPVIKEATSYEKYTELLSSPFYINEIVSKSVDLSELSDINEFRAFIWKECICLNKIASEKAIPTNEVVRTIKSLAIERSKNFVTGIPKDELDAKILDLLRSNNVITNKDSLVRFKYDIYEDICFEKLFDAEFDACKGVYSSFFSSVENMGYGAYRRYQIWISNKLLARENRDKFLNTLLFSNGITSEWHRNTIIGLVKSIYCKDYFIEQEKKLIAENRVQELIDIINCFSFEMGMLYYNEIKSICQLRLRAVGYGRIALINLIFENGLYKNDYLIKDKIIKLCNDYAIRSKHFEDADEHACAIISYYIDEYLDNCKSDYISQEISILAPMLEVLYALPVNSHKWLNDFWRKLIKSYTEGDDRKARIAEELLKWTLEHPTIALVDEKIND